MIVLIDTSSLLSLVRYYLPFDKDDLLLTLIQTKIDEDEILVIDKVAEECKYVAKGIVLEKLTFLKDKKALVSTIDILPTNKFFNQLENNFINRSARNKISDVEFENRKNAFLESADSKLLLYCLNNKDRSITIVSEETETANDHKSFKKLPALCSFLNLEIITLPKLLEDFAEIDIEFKQ